MIKKLLFLSSCFLLNLAQVSYSPIPGLDSSDYSYGGLISTEMLSTVTLYLEPETDWTLADIAQLYYGYEEYWPLLRAANPSLLKEKSSSYWSTKDQYYAPLPTPNYVLIPSLLTCVEFMPLTCINNALMYFNKTQPTEFLSVEMSVETENMLAYVNNILGMNDVSSSVYNALTNLQITLSWTTSTKQTPRSTIDVFSSPAMVFAIQAYHMNVENPTIINITLINKGTLDFSNALTYQPEGMGMTSIPGPLLSQNGTTTLISLESNDLKGTTGLLHMGTLQNSPATGPALQIYWEIKNSDIFPNKVSVNLATPSTTDLSSNFEYKQFDSDFIVDESRTGKVLALTGYNYQAIVQITNARICQVVITLSQNSLGKVYDESNYYAITTFPNTTASTLGQGLWFSPAESLQIFTGLLQYEISQPIADRNSQWKLFQVKPNIYNIWNLCSGIFIQADSSFNLLSFTTVRTGNADIQWNFLPASLDGYVIIQSLSLPNQCLTASPNLDGSGLGIHDLPIYLSDCSMIDKDQMFRINASQPLGPAKSSCTLSRTVIDSS